MSRKLRDEQSKWNNSLCVEAEENSIEMDKQTDDRFVYISQQEDCNKICNPFLKGERRIFFSRSIEIISTTKKHQLIFSSPKTSLYFIRLPKFSPLNSCFFFFFEISKYPVFFLICLQIFSFLSRIIWILREFNSRPC